MLPVIRLWEEARGTADLSVELLDATNTGEARCELGSGANLEPRRAGLGRPAPRRADRLVRGRDAVRGRLSCRRLRSLIAPLDK